MRPTTLMLGALLAIAALLSGCSAGPGPLGNGGDSARQCAPTRQGQTRMMGIYALENQGKSPVTIQGVPLSSPNGVKMTGGAWVLPIFNHTLVGPGPWPPSGPAWAMRLRAAGAVIQPGQAMNLVFGVTRTSANAGRSDGPAISYSADGSTFTLQENISLILADSCRN